MRLAVVIPAAGSSARMQAGMNKVFIEIAGKPILIHTLENIAKCEYVGTVFVVVGAQDVEPTKDLLQKYQDTFLRSLGKFWLEAVSASTQCLVHLNF